MNFTGNVELNEDFKVSFGLNIAGTSANPSEVRVFLSCCETIRLCSLATLNSATNEYETSIPILASLFSGKTEAKLSIEVVLNGKVITPYSQSINLQSPSVEVIPDTIRPISQDALRQAAKRYEPGQVDEPFSRAAETLTKAATKVFSFEDLIDKEEIKKPIVADEVVEEPSSKKQIQFKRPVIERKKEKAETVQLDLGSLVEEAEVKLKVSKPKAKPSVIIDQPVKIVKEQSSSLFRLSKTKIVER